MSDEQVDLKEGHHDWQTVEKYNYVWDSRGQVTIQIKAEGTWLEDWKFKPEEAIIATNLLQMLRFHKCCEVNTSTGKTMRVNGRFVGVG